MCAEDNIQVVNCTSPANYFHALRRQLHRDFRKPLVIMTPKSTLRHKKNTSSIEEFTNGSTFHRILRKELTSDQKSKVNRLLLCSGKIYFELDDHLEKLKKDHVHILRFDQLYPFPYEVLKEEVLQFPNAELFWVQEEPSNMGAFRFVKHRIESVLQGITGKYKELLFIGRKASASPATGIANRHAENQANIIKLAVESDINEIKKHKDGVTLVKFKLPIE